MESDSLRGSIQVLLVFDIILLMYLTKHWKTIGLYFYKIFLGRLNSNKKPFN